MDPKTLNLDPDLEFWPNLDPDPGLCYTVHFGKKIQIFFREKQFSLKITFLKYRKLIRGTFSQLSL